MASYSINFAEVGKQHTALTEQLAELSKVLEEVKGIEETMLTAAQWTASDRKDFDEKTTAFNESGANLHKAGTTMADALQKISDAYKNAEQH